MPKFISTLIVIAALCLIALWISPNGGSPLDRRDRTLKQPQAELPQYKEVIAGIERRRVSLAAGLRESRTPTERSEILEEGRRLLLNALSRDLPAHWVGTPWDFNGTSESPGEGQIACGYFVSTLLRDAGFGVERVRLAQQPSANIIRTLAVGGNITRMIGDPFAEFSSALRASGTGVYLVGLDRHVGLIAQTREGAAFIHSDGGREKCVIVEPVEDSRSLRRWRWREFANLSDDDELIQNWLLGRPFPTAIR